MDMFQGKTGEMVEVVHALTALGLLRRENEELDVFLRRSCQLLRPIGIKRLKAVRKLTNAPLTTLPPRIKAQGLKRLKEIYGWTPWWVPMFSLSSRSLLNGGAMWLLECQRTGEQFPVVWVRMSGAFRLDPIEAVAHEGVHAVRSPLPSSWLEEYYAYSTSTVWWHRYLGLFLITPWLPWLIFAFVMGGLYQAWFW